MSPQQQLKLRPMRNDRVIYFGFNVCAFGRLSLFLFSREKNDSRRETIPFLSLSFVQQMIQIADPGQENWRREVQPTPPIPNEINAQARETEYGKPVVPYPETSPLQKGDNIFQLVPFALMTPRLILIHFPRRHRHGKNEPAARPKTTSHLAQCRGIIRNVLKDLQEQHGVQGFIAERKVFGIHNHESKVPFPLVTSPDASERSGVNIGGPDLLRIGAEISGEYARATTEVCNNAEIIAEEIVNDFVFRWLLNSDSISNKGVIESPSPIRSPQL
jgi:hypothetical protein